MTYDPPGNPPPGPPSGGYGAPQGGGYGQPPQGGAGQPGGYGGPAGAGGPNSVNLATVNPLDWAAMGLAVIAFIFSFISYYTANVDFSGTCSSAVKNAVNKNVNALSNNTESAWHGVFGWLGVILALLAALVIAAAIFAPQVRMPFPIRLVAVGAFALGVISTLLALVVDPEDTSGKKAVVPGTSCTVQAAIGHGVGYWVTLIAIILGTVAAFLAFQRAGGGLANLGGHGSGAGGSGPTPGQGGYGQPSDPQAPPSGYGQPSDPQAPPSGYGQPQAPQAPPPQAPPAGYETPPGPGR
ncbi:MAG: hypothetical protein ACR2LX_14470 [Jatrophihabitans sp.]